MKDRYEDYRVKKKIETLLPVESNGILSWRDYNRSFFGALRTEKSVMMLLVSLIFVVVGINIFHAMRRTIAVKMADIAVLKALGASNSDIRRIFSGDGILVGAGGAAAGTALGLVLLANINQLLDVAATIVRAARRPFSKHRDFFIKRRLSAFFPLVFLHRSHSGFHFLGRADIHRLYRRRVHGYRGLARVQKSIRG